MFGRRSDGKKLKGVDPIQKIMPHIMPKRSDAQNYFKISVDCAPFDDFIDAERGDGVSYNYMHIVIAAAVRVFALRPQINRFIMNGRIFQRNNIQMSFVVKRKLKDEGQSTTIKLTFKGDEDILAVKNAIDDAVALNMKKDAVNNTDKTAKLLTNMPNFLVKAGMAVVRWLDKHGMLPRAIVNASPFHTSCFITNMKSIKTGYLYHHLYDFGTTGCFFGMGKEGAEPVVLPDGSIGSAKIMKIGVVTDERFCDGLYYANSLRLVQKYFAEPALLKEKPELPA